MAKKENEQPKAAPETEEVQVHDLVTAAEAGELCGKSGGYFSARAKRGASLPPVAASAGRSVFYERKAVLKWWEVAQHEKVSMGRRSNLPEGVKSRASVMLLDEEWEALKALKPQSMTNVDFIREALVSMIE